MAATKRKKRLTKKEIRRLKITPYISKCAGAIVLLIGIFLIIAGFVYINSPTESIWKFGPIHAIILGIIGIVIGILSLMGKIIWRPSPASF